MIDRAETLLRLGMAVAAHHQAVSGGSIFDVPVPTKDNSSTRDAVDARFKELEAYAAGNADFKLPLHGRRQALKFDVCVALAAVLYNEVMGNGYGVAYTSKIIGTLDGDQVRGLLTAREAIGKLLLCSALDIGEGESLVVGGELKSYLSFGSALGLGLTKASLEVHRQKRRMAPSARGDAPKARPIPGSSSVSIPCLTAKEIYSRLTQEVVGQEHVLKLLSARGELHLQKANLILAGQEVRAPNEIVFIIGPSGSGKSYICDRFGKACGLASAIVSATDYTETGYTGLDVDDMFLQCIQAAGGNALLARFSILAIDEIDKKAARGTDANGRDATGAGFQHTLLRALESSELMLNRKRWTRDSPVPYTTLGGFFVLAGAFEGLEELVRSLGRRSGIGFAASTNDPHACHRIQDALVEYGMLRQLINRATAYAVLRKPSEEELKAILVRHIVPAYGQILEQKGLFISLSDAACSCIAEYGHSSRTLSRGMKLLLSRIIERLVFEEATGLVQVSKSDIEGAIGSLSFGEPDKGEDDHAGEKAS